MFLGSLFSQINLALPVVNTLCAFALERTIPVSVLSGGFLSCADDFDLFSLSLSYSFLGGGSWFLFIHFKRERWCFSSLSVCSSHDGNFKKRNTVEKMLMIFLQKYPLLLVQTES